MGEDNGRQDDALKGARLRRRALKAVVSSVEIAASSPVGDPNWRSNLRAELQSLRDALDAHIEEVEAEDGILAQLTVDAPRLVNKIDRVRQEHPELSRQLANAIASLESSSNAEELRGEVLAVLFSLVRHRQRGADLVYEGYNVDIGGG